MGMGGSRGATAEGCPLPAPTSVLLSAAQVPVSLLKYAPNSGGLNPLLGPQQVAMLNQLSQLSQISQLQVSEVARSPSLKGRPHPRLPPKPPCLPCYSACWPSRGRRRVSGAWLQVAGSSRYGWAFLDGTSKRLRAPPGKKPQQWEVGESSGEAGVSGRRAGESVPVARPVSVPDCLCRRVR